VRFRSLAPLIAAAGLACGKSAPTEPPPPPEYALNLTWLGTAPSAAVQASFTRAVARIKTIVVGGLTPVSLPDGFTNVSQCDANLVGFPDVPDVVIEGLDIYVRVQAIDGAGGVLGNAGPCLVRQSNNYKPALGVMRLDEADLENLTTARLDALILHEMLHVVGIGTVWSDNALLSGDQTDDARFLGAQARTACANVHGGTTTCAATVPVHSTDGAGSAYSHWRESVFGSELMTPFLNAGAIPLSEMSIRSLADMGYVVSVTSADPFTLAAALRVAGAEDAEAPALPLGEPMRPRFAVSASGGLFPLADAH
jgi:hypothetical protein